MHAHTLRHMHAVNASLNCIYPPKCASINPEGRNTDTDEDQCVSVAVQLISEIRWRPFREMRTENERWRERDGEERVSSTESDGTDVERERETDKEAKTGIETDS